MPKIRILRLILLLVILVIIGNIVRTSLKTIESVQRVENLEAEVAGIQQENANLRRLLSSRNTDAYVESVARNKLNMMKSGDTLIVTFGEEAFADSESSEEQVQITALPPLEQWIVLLHPGF